MYDSTCVFLSIGVGSEGSYSDVNIIRQLPQISYSQQTHLISKLHYHNHSIEPMITEIRGEEHFFHPPHLAQMKLSETDMVVATLHNV